ncbi:MAG: FtsX-like permease family protein, partial [Lachnospiraceae bacterium]|nr:FtsX-like permease family protein [Lachnospiraceae bacterium]
NTSLDSEKITEDVEKTLVSSGSSDGYLVSDMAGQKGVLDNLLNIVTLVLTVIGAIALLVSGISIMNIMLISVNERTREIGIKKSIGATAADIMRDFLAESVLISLIGAATGVVCSVIIVKIASVYIGMSVSVSFTVALGTMAVAMAVGVVFGIFPAYKASCFNPVEALRR